METMHGKLVRDKVPQIIEASGRKPIFRILEFGEYTVELALKVPEEGREYIENPTIEELADLLEIVISMREAMGISEAELEEARLRKAESNGRFENRIYLESVEE